MGRLELILLRVIVSAAPPLAPIDLGLGNLTIRSGRVGSRTAIGNYQRLLPFFLLRNGARRDRCVGYAARLISAALVRWRRFDDMDPSLAAISDF
jgi:hypothetical protein